MFRIINTSLTSQMTRMCNMKMLLIKNNHLYTQKKISNNNVEKIIEKFLDIYPSFIVLTGFTGCSMGFYHSYILSRKQPLIDCIGVTVCNTILGGCGGTMIGILSPLILPIATVTLATHYIDNLCNTL